MADALFSIKKGEKFELLGRSQTLPSEITKILTKSWYARRISWVVKFGDARFVELDRLELRMLSGSSNAGWCFRIPEFVVGLLTGSITPQNEAAKALKLKLTSSVQSIAQAGSAP